MEASYPSEDCCSSGSGNQSSSVSSKTTQREVVGLRGGVLSGDMAVEHLTSRAEGAPILKSINIRPECPDPAMVGI